LLRVNVLFYCILHICVQQIKLYTISHKTVANKLSFKSLLTEIAVSLLNITQYASKFNDGRKRSLLWPVRDNPAPKRQSDIKIMMGDFNAKIGDDSLGVKHVMGRYGLGNRNENGERLIDLWVHYEMIIVGSLFPNKDIHKATWVVPNHRTSHQIDHIDISKKWRRSLLDVRSYKGADVASDHYLVVAQIKLKLAANRSPNQPVIRKKFNIEKLNQRETRKKF
jgi:hypothetical protein